MTATGMRHDGCLVGRCRAGGREATVPEIFGPEEQVIFRGEWAALHRP